MHDTITQIHAVRTDTAREFAVAQLQHTTMLVTMRAVTARYEQARAMLTYLENIQYTLERQHECMPS